MISCLDDVWTLDQMLASHVSTNNMDFVVSRWLEGQSPGYLKEVNAALHVSSMGGHQGVHRRVPFNGQNLKMTELH